MYSNVTRFYGVPLQKEKFQARYKLWFSLLFLLHKEYPLAALRDDVAMYVHENDCFLISKDAR